MNELNSAILIAILTAVTTSIVSEVTKFILKRFTKSMQQNPKPRAKNITSLLLNRFKSSIAVFFFLVPIGFGLFRLYILLNDFSKPVTTETLSLVVVYVLYIFFWVVWIAFLNYSVLLSRIKAINAHLKLHNTHHETTLSVIKAYRQLDHFNEKQQ